MDHDLKCENACDDDSVIKRFGVLAKRSEAYEKWVVEKLHAHKCRRILDAACGTGVDCLFLVENGFDVVSSDSSEAMLHYARQARDTYRSQHEGVVNWDIENADWLSLKEALPGYGKFDAVLCLGNSIVTLIDPTPNWDLYRRSLENFKYMLEPGGVLLIDHRNVDTMIDNGVPVNKNVYFQRDTIHNMSSEILQCNGERNVINVTFDMIVAPDTLDKAEKSTQICSENRTIEKVVIPFQPLRAKKFANMLAEVFGHGSEQHLYGDLKLHGTVSDPAYYQHVIKYDDNNN